jgi:cytochrome c
VRETLGRARFVGNVVRCTNCHALIVLLEDPSY